MRGDDGQVLWSWSGLPFQNKSGYVSLMLSGVVEEQRNRIGQHPKSNISVHPVQVV